MSKKQLVREIRDIMISRALEGTAIFPLCSDKVPDKIDIGGVSIMGLIPDDCEWQSESQIVAANGAIVADLCSGQSWPGLPTEARDYIKEIKARSKDVIDGKVDAYPCDFINHVVLTSYHRRDFGGLICMIAMREFKRLKPLEPSNDPIPEYYMSTEQAEA